METPNPRYQDHLQHEMAIAYCRSIDLCGEGFDIQAALMVYLFYELLPQLDGRWSPWTEAGARNNERGHRRDRDHTAADGRADADNFPIEGQYGEGVHLAQRRHRGQGDTGSAG